MSGADGVGQLEAARPGRLHDIDRLVGIAVDHAGSLTDQRGADLLLRRELDHSVDGLRALLTGALDDPDADLIVGTYDGVPFGYGLVVYERLTDQSLLARLEQLVVEADARKVGVGEAIMTAILEQAKARGCFGIDSWALPGDRETKNFFESFGLKARQLVVHRTLD